MSNPTTPDLTPTPAQVLELLARYLEADNRWAEIQDAPEYNPAADAQAEQDYLNALGLLTELGPDLIRAHAEALERERWIPVGERLPERLQRVLAYLPAEGEAELCIYQAHTGGWYSLEEQFQSTPAHQDGRNRRGPPASAGPRSFNPLPPTRTGETYWVLTWRSASGKFQSTPAHQDGRNRRG